MPETNLNIAQQVTAALAEQPIIDMHTHLYPPSFGTTLGGKGGTSDPTGHLLWGIDELLTYHYLISEVYRIVPTEKLPYEQFWKMSKQQQADHIFKHLFVERAPISEACRGVLTAVQKLGLDPSDSLQNWRKYFAEQTPSKYIDRVMELSNVRSITMTNAVFDDAERNRWLADAKVGADPRFTAVLRIDPLLRNWPLAASRLSEWGYAADADIDDSSIESAKKFLRDWLDRMKAIYIAVSLPPDWRYPSHDASQTVLEKVILPVCAERGLPFAMMIGSNLRVNPALRDAGDMVGKADIASLVNLCREFPKNKFFVTMLSRENQHELAVAARKFGNLMIFGCWWFLNNPSLVEEITRMRIELLGTSFIPQHSDARVLDQLLYKWDHSKNTIGKVLADKFQEMATAGRPPTPQQIRQTVDLFFATNFRDFLKR
ncbi:MAG TPA: hypothetical protein VGG19_14945 [Tepidisphaeraceae bacterium]|jgi:hypothetical protein